MIGRIFSIHHTREYTLDSKKTMSILIVNLLIFEFRAETIYIRSSLNEGKYLLECPNLLGEIDYLIFPR